MDMILGGIGFAALIIGQFSAVIAVHGEREIRDAAKEPPHTDHRARLIWEGGY